MLEAGPRTTDGRRLLIYAVVGSTFYRLLYGLLVDSPTRALDARTYESVAAGFAHFGFLSPDVPYLPYYPGGFPAVVGVLYSVFGVHPRLVIWFQVLLIAAATWSAWHFIAREIGRRVANVVAVMLALSPALTAITSLLAYEPLLAATLAFSLDAVSRAIRTESRGRLAWSTAAGLALGLGVVAQAKVLPVALVIAIWALARTRNLVPVVAFALATAVVPVAYGLRTQHVDGRFNFASTNLGGNMVIGFHDGASGGWAATPDAGTSCQPNHYVRHWPGDSAFRSEHHLQKCATDWISRHWSRLPILEAKKVLYFFSPTIGPPERVELLRDFDYRRALPNSIRSASWFTKFDTVSRGVWTVALILVLLLGFLLVVPLARSAALVCALTVLSFLPATLVTFGDFRYRIPLEPFCFTFQAVVLLVAYDWLRRRRAARG